jgi:hypothetical protein
MSIIVCPGMHSPALTEQFLDGLGGLPDATIFPSDRYPPYSGYHILEFLQEQYNPSASPLIFVAFSAGVIGAIAAAHRWQQLEGQVKALIALDGWGVPLRGTFPIHRLSHDHFTYWSSALIGGEGDSFYADPAVAHLELWQSPQLVQGWRVRSPSPPHQSNCLPAQIGQADSCTSTTAAQFLLALLNQYTKSPV